MFRDPVQNPVHGIVRDQVDFVPPVRKIFSPALGMDAAAVSNEDDDHRIPLGTSGMYIPVIITSSSLFRKQVSYHLEKSPEQDRER
jgi:hypothetical protein